MAPLIANRLSYYLTLWDLSHPERIAETQTSDVYTVAHDGQTLILKILSTSEIEEQRGATALRHFGGRGAVRLKRADEGAQLMEYASGDELVTLVEQDRDEEATLIIAGVIRELHAAGQPAATDDLMPLDRWFRALFLQAESERKAGVTSIVGRGAAVAQRLLAHSRDIRVLHGDIHHRNLRHSARGWLAFDPKGLVGERTYECANTLCNPGGFELVHQPSRLLANATLLTRELELDLTRLLDFTYAYACLSASWWSETGTDRARELAEWHLAIAGLLEHPTMGTRTP